MFRQKTFIVIWLTMLFTGLVLSTQAHDEASHSHAEGALDHDLNGFADSDHEGVEYEEVWVSVPWPDDGIVREGNCKDVGPWVGVTSVQHTECETWPTNSALVKMYDNHSHKLKEGHTHDDAPAEQRPVVIAPKPPMPPGPEVPPAIPEMPTVPEPIPEMPQPPPTVPEQPAVPEQPVDETEDTDTVEDEQTQNEQRQDEQTQNEQASGEIYVPSDAPYYPGRDEGDDDDSTTEQRLRRQPDTPLSKELVISEMMLDMGIRNRWPQWIEIHNLSDALYANLSGWKIVVENEKEKGLRRSFTLRLKGVRIKSGQTTLITSYRFRNSGEENFLQENIVAIYENHRNAIRMRNYDEQIFSFTGLNIKLIDPDENVVDEVGNIDGDRRTADKPAWDILASENPKFRSSIMRVYSNKKPVDGTEAYAWVLAENAHARNKRHETYYGNPRDISGPGYHSNFPLPVQMSAFSAKLDGEKIFIEWTTSSELNNAGFNLLRSDSENGTYVRINKALIPGRGTVSEMTSYVWEDKSANENTAYYYRIEDVSFDGDTSVVGNTHMKGFISPASKSLTTWGSLKTSSN